MGWGANNLGINAGTYLHFSTYDAGWQERMRIDNDGSTSFSGGMTYSGVRAVTGSTDLLTTDYFLYLTISGAITITIPTAQCIPGRVFYIKDQFGYASSYNVSVTCEGSETIDGGATTVVIATNKGAAMLICATSSLWYTLGMNDVA